MTITTSSARRPRGIVKINGQPVSFLRANVESKGHFSSDTWRVSLEAWNQPEGFGMAYWSDATDVQVEILFGFLDPSDDVSAQPTNITSLIIGQVDDVEINPLDSDSLVISGRDLSAQLIDAKTTNKYPDHVSSWIATTIANQFGLTPQVTPTTEPVGQYYKDAYSAIARDIPYWDLLVYLAEQEDFDLYVRGKTLYFGPPQAETDTNPIIINVNNTNNNVIESNATGLRLHRSLTIAKDVIVTVLSHGVYAGKAIKSVTQRVGKGGSANALHYQYRRPNMTQAQAQNFANKKLVDITKFERTFDATMEGDPLLTVQNKAIIQGTQTSFDQPYYIQQISRTLDFEGGFVMSIQGKNVSTVASPEE